jgi:hypothetical protein
VNEENVDGHAVRKPDHDQANRRGWLILGAAGVVAAFRLYQCGMLPYETGDIVRHVLYGVAVDQQGIAAAGIPLQSLSGAWSNVAWARFPYSYPPIALAFFALIASISPSVFAAKLALTLIEAGNACLISKLTRSRILGLLYWASPLSIWWVSREGQFEPLQSLFMLLAIAAAFELQFVSGAALALAASVKVTAGALVPWLAGVIWPRGWRARGLAVLGLVVGLVPAIASEAMYGGISNVMRYSSLLIYNPYYWNPWADLFTGNTPLQIAANEIASYGLLATLIALAFRSRNWLPFIAPIAFAVFCKVHTNVQFWYWLLLPAFLVPLPNPRWRFALIALCPLLDIHSLLELVSGPMGPVRFHGLPSAFDIYTIH